MTARVVALHVAAEHGSPMVAVDEVTAERGAGLVGDRHHGTRHRHVSVQCVDDLDDAARNLGAPVPAGRTRRNVTLDGGRVPVVPGERFAIGNVVLEVVRPAAPCRMMDTAVAAGARRALSRRGGAVCRVLRSGTIALGEPVCEDPAVLADMSDSVDAR